MSPASVHILTVNSGSSSARFSLYILGPDERRLIAARCDGIGLAQGRFAVQDEHGKILFESALGIPDHETASRRFVDWLHRSADGAPIDGVGHRFLHGGTRFIEPVTVTPAVEEELRRIVRVGPESIFPELRVLGAVRTLLPGLPNVACFDTAFHRSMPAVAQMHPLPRELYERGIVRFGSHGLSCDSLMRRLGSEAGEGAAQGRVVIAHLGGSSSMAAVYAGQSVDATTGYMPSGGLMMGTRPGDLCSGVLLHLLVDEGLSAGEINRMVNLQSGLLGVSGVSRDMKELLKVVETNPRAAEAVELFCYTAKKHLGALAAVLGGLDTLIFSGGIGENAPAIRRRICERMDFLGIRLDQARNARNAPVISVDGGPVTVRVMASDEDLVISRATARAVRLAA